LTASSDWLQLTITDGSNATAAFAILADLSHRGVARLLVSSSNGWAWTT
jgi:hypothetical protein